MQSPSLGQADAAGEQALVWRDVAIDVPAAVEQLDGTELWKAQQIQPEATYRVRLRWLPGVGEAERLLFDGATLAILSAKSDARRRSIECLCKEQR